MRRLSTIFIAFLFATIFAASAFSQERMSRSEIYDRWDELNLTKTTGKGRLTWLPNGMGYLEVENHVFYRVNPKNKKRRRLFDKSTEKNLIRKYNKLTGKSGTNLPFRRFEYLTDNSGIQFKIHGGDEFIYKFREKELMKLPKSRGEVAGWVPHRSSRQLKTGSYSPDFKKIAYVKNYDIFVFDSQTGEEKQITFGGTNEIMNGRTDWVYPEELYQSDAFWWSPNGRKIAYFQFDVRAEYKYPLLHEIDLTKDGIDHYRFETLLEIERYPKAGEPNATVKLFIADLTTGQKVEVKTDSSPDIYLIKVVWRRDGSELLFQKLNRFQNRLELLAANPRNGQVRTVLVEEEKCFVRTHNNFRQLNDCKHFLWSSERTGWNHLYLYNFQGNLVKQLTDGNWEVARIQCVDEKGRFVYFSTYMKDGLESHFCRVKFDGTGFKQLTTAEGSHRVSIDPAGKYYTDNYSSLKTPSVVNLHQSNGKLIRNLAKTTLNTTKMKELGLELPELVFFKAADGKTDLHAILYKPAQYDVHKKYPLIVSVYGGPTGGVRNSFSIGNRMAQLGYFVIKQDNRGTTNRGKKYLTETYMKFGQVEIDDQATGVKQITQRAYIDGSRVGITGGSYGGYATCMSLLRYPDVYKAGVAMSSVTDWRSYDSIYTERYMRTPQANPEGYRLGSAMTYAKDLQGKLLLTHGLIDNNVNFGNSIHLADALQKAGKDFDFMVYPENRHGIRGYHRLHLNKLRTAHFLKYLQPEGWQERLKKVWQ